MTYMTYFLTAHFVYQLPNLCFYLKVCLIIPTSVFSSNFPFCMCVR